ncbi:hypothetical protein VZ94_10745 [Methylocucumis oryzae]|uniref:RNA 2',3'-cyclic phosphodiesterase n=2 Tax=Methylocucumis oryzae TaxID=1632867 RepID=A0A0F3IIZ4_9GAMM|nr:hypothetical protein VZ94_10745 [Methylocucumis oryzae]
MTASQRLFFALWPEQRIRQQLINVQSSLTAPGRFVLPENLHVTLSFLGNVSSDSRLLLLEQATALTEHTAFTLIFEDIQFWPTSGVVCLTTRVIPETIVLIAEKLNRLARELGLNVDTRPYQPHVTLARDSSKIEALGLIQPITWSATHFCLVESCVNSEGVIYQIIQEWPFDKC